MQKLSIQTHKSRKSLQDSIFGYGITNRLYYEGSEIPVRCCPSAGALYPYEIYPIVFNISNVNKAIYHYNPTDHTLELLKASEFIDQVIQLFFNQSYIANSSVCIILSSVLERTTWKYGSRGYRYLLMEAGHIVQNMCLVSTAEGLGALHLVAFDDNSLARLIDLDLVYEPVIYGLIIGHKKDGNLS